jgi:hypothetical protein
MPKSKPKARAKALAQKARRPAPRTKPALVAGTARDGPVAFVLWGRGRTWPPKRAEPRKSRLPHHQLGEAARLARLVPMSSRLTSTIHARTRRGQSDAPLEVLDGTTCLRTNA